MSEISIVFGDVITFMFTTHSPNGGAIAPSNPFDTSDIDVYKDNGTTIKVTDNGITVASPVNSVVGLHHLQLNTGNSSGDVGFWEKGSRYIVILNPDTETVNSEAVIEVVGRFKILPDVTQTGFRREKITRADLDKKMQVILNEVRNMKNETRRSNRGGDNAN